MSGSDGTRHPARTSILALARGRVTGVESSVIQQHLDDCEECRRIHNELERNEPSPPRPMAWNGPTTIVPDESEIVKPPPQISRIPSRIGKYTIRRELGKGGMGVVYLAEDVPINRLVAVKVIADAGRHERDSPEGFQCEAEAGQHPELSLRS